MGLLSLDVSGVGIIMSSDSRGICIRNGEYDILPTRDDRPKQLKINCGNFLGLLGYIGTEKIGNSDTRSWLEKFARSNNSLSLQQFMNKLAEELSSDWREKGIATGLWVFVAGYESDEARFWYTFNGNLNTETGFYENITTNFEAINDLDPNHIEPHMKKFQQTKEQVLLQTTYYFRNGALVPATTIFDAFNKLLINLQNNNYPGFDESTTLKKRAYFARNRLELIKRLFSPKHGIYSQEKAPIGGNVIVISVSPSGSFKQYLKNTTKDI